MTAIDITDPAADLSAAEQRVLEMTEAEVIASLPPGLLQQIGRVTKAVAESRAEAALIWSTFTSLAVVLADGPVHEREYLVQLLDDNRKSAELWRPFMDMLVITGFGSAREPKHSQKWDEVAEAHKLLFDAGYGTVSGAGPGFMEALMEHVGPTHLFLSRLFLPFEPPSESALQHSKFIMVKLFDIRLRSMIDPADGFTFAPGGSGTLQEFGMVWSPVANGTLRKVPSMVFYDKEFWRGMFEWFDKQMLERGYINKQDRDIFVVTDEPIEVLQEHNRFHRNFAGVKKIGINTYEIRLRVPPTDAEIDMLNERFERFITPDGFKRNRASQEDRAMGRMPLHPRLTVTMTTRSFSTMHLIARELGDLKSAAQFFDKVGLSDPILQGRFVTSGGFAFPSQEAGLRAYTEMDMAALTNGGGLNGSATDFTVHPAERIQAAMDASATR